MVHRPADSRLLSNLLQHEKDYTKHLLALLDASHASLASFSAYASASSPPASHAIIAVASSFQGADDALRRYALSVDQWRDYLTALKTLEDEVGNTMRDREILVTRLIKTSNKQKPNRDSILLPSSSHSHSSVSSYSLTRDTSSSKLHVATAELQACEARLAEQERELQQMRISTVQRGLLARCHALVECGMVWGEKGRDGLAALDSCFGNAVVPYPIDQHFHKPLPDPSFKSHDRDRGSISDISSILPSHSASQLALNFHNGNGNGNNPSSPPTSVLVEHHHPGPHGLGATYTYTSLAMPTSPTLPPIPGPLTGTPPPPPPHNQNQNYALVIPPAHSIVDNVLPQPITEEPLEDVLEEEEEGGSSAEEEDAGEEGEGGEGRFEVVENRNIFASVTQQQQQRAPSPPPPNVNARASSPTTHRPALKRSNTGGSRNAGGRHSPQLQPPLQQPLPLPSLTLPQHPQSVLITHPNPVSQQFFSPTAAAGHRFPSPASDADSTLSAPVTGRGRDKGRKRSGSLFGSITRFFGGGSGRKEEAASSPYLQHGHGGAWTTRTDRNLKTRGDDSSDEEDVSHTIVVNQNFGTGRGSRAGTGSGRARSLPPSPLRAVFSPPSNPALPLPSGSTATLDDDTAGARLKRKGTSASRKSTASASASSGLGPGSKPSKAKKKKGATAPAANATSAADAGWVSDGGVAAPLRTSAGTALVLVDGLASSSTTTTATTPGGGTVKRRKSAKSATSDNGDALRAAAATTATTHRRAGSLDLPRSSSPLAGGGVLTSTVTTSPAAKKNAAGRNTISGGSSPTVWPPSKGKTHAHGESLMTIVEGVAAANRATAAGRLIGDSSTSWKGSQAGAAGGWKGADSSTALIDLRAPSGSTTVTTGTVVAGKAAGKVQMVLTPPTPPEKAHLQDYLSGTGTGGGGIMERRKSVSDSSLPLALALNLASSSTAGHIAFNSASNSVQKKPLKSALRNRSPSPLSTSTVGTASGSNTPPSQTQTQAQVQVASGQRGRPRMPTKAVRSTSSGSGTVPNGIILQASTPSNDNADADDTVSLTSSYETGHESLESEIDTPAPPPHDHGEDPPQTPTKITVGLPPNTGTPSTIKSPPPPPLQTDLSPSAPAPPGTDLSFSSTETAPTRRKSVRMSLEPTFSTTPPAIDDDDDGEEGARSKAPWATSGPRSSNRSSSSGWQVRNTGPASHVNGTAVPSDGPDLWNDSSDEDGEYSRARKMLSRASKKMAKVGKGGA